MTITKNTLGGDGTFGYTGTLGLATLTTSGGTISQSFTNLAPGPFTVAENDPAPGFDFTNLVCVDPDNGTVVTLATRSAAIDVDAGESITCTYTNTKRGTISIRKVTAPANAPPDQFTFSGAISGTIGNGGSLPAAGPLSVSPGLHTVTEAAAPGWDLASITCSDANSAADTTNPRQANFNVEAGENVVCTFTNSQAAMPVTKLIAGRLPLCTDPNNTPTNPFDDTTPCTDIVLGTLPQFQINLYLNIDGDPTQPDGFPASSLATLFIPPAVDPPAPIGIPFFICEMNLLTGWRLPNNGVTVIPTPGSPFNPPVITPTASDGNDRCFSVLIPPGTTRFEISINNNPASRIIVKKKTFGGDATFTYTGSGPGLPTSFTILTSGGTGTALNANDEPAFAVQPGSFSITENDLTGWDKTGVDCKKGTNTVDNTNFSMLAGDTVTCEFTNTKKGSITVRKATSPSNAPPDQFTFSGALSGPIGNGQQIGPTTVSANTTTGYLVTEAAALGWDLASITCDDGASATPSTFDTVARTATFKVDPGESVICTFNNSQARMPVTKLVSGRTPQCATVLNPATPDPDDTMLAPPCTDSVVGLLPQFQLNLYLNIDGDPTQPDGFPASSLATLFIPPLVDPPAPIGIPFFLCEMNLTAGWRLPNNGVTVTPTPGSPFNPPVITPTGGGGDDRCFSVVIPPLTTDFAISINNNPVGRVIVNKTTVGGDGTFAFTTTGGDGFTGPLSITTLNGSGTALNNQGFPAFAVVPGTYSVTETADPAWEQTSAQCLKGTTPVTQPFSVGIGETVTCTFTNTKKPTLTVVKALFPTNDPGKFDLNVNGTVPALGTNVGNGGTTGAIFANISPTVNNFGEVTNAGSPTSLAQYVSSIVCTGTGGSNPVDNGNGTGSITLAAGADVTCTITNRRRGSILIIKDAVPNSPDNFTFTITGGLTPSPFNLDDDADGALSNTQSFSSLGTFTSYTVTEAVQAGWVVTGISCNGDNNGSTDKTARTATINLDPGENVTCTFTNKVPGTITIVKDAIPNGPTDFSFNSSGLTPSTFILDDDNDPTWSNQQVFTNVVPDIQYLISEGNLSRDWELDSVVCTADAGSTFTINNNPKNVQITLGSAGNVRCVFTNKLLGQRMTGGGSVWYGDVRASVRVTHGFELHCNINIPPNNLEINWDRGNRFHLETFDSVVCSDTPGIAPKPPSVGFDTLVGTGTGRYNGQLGYSIEWTFTDAGEPGTQDTAIYLIYKTGTDKTNPANVVLQITAPNLTTGNIINGNQQAHK